MAITFDDGPHAVNTPKLPELFKKDDAKATFFVVGRGVGKCPELAKRMLAEGHELGNHTTTHADLAKLGDLEKVRKEIDDTQRILKETIGKPAVIFRAPFLSHDENVWTVLKDMPAINASRDTKDWSGDSTPQSIFDQATRDTKAGDIVLMHSWQNKMIEAMPRIIKALQAKGLKLVTVSELLAAADKPVAPATTKSKGKRVFLSAAKPVAAVSAKIAVAMAAIGKVLGVIDLLIMKFVPSRECIKLIPRRISYVRSRKFSHSCRSGPRSSHDGLMMFFISQEIAFICPRLSLSRLRVAPRR